MALVAGWGLTKVCNLGNSLEIILNRFLLFLQSHEVSAILQSFDIPIVNFRTCKEKAPEHFKSKVIGDKVSSQLSFDSL